MATQAKTKLKEKEIKSESRKWYLIDAKNKILGRLSTKIAEILMGKRKISFKPYLDSGDYVIILNASKVAVTGDKEQNKTYFRYSGYPGGLRSSKFRELKKTKPNEIIFHAVAGMLPKNKLGKALIKKLYIYSGDKHPHESQKPERLEV